MACVLSISRLDGSPGSRVRSDGFLDPPDPRPVRPAPSLAREIVVDQNGAPRQAGATPGVSGIIPPQLAEWRSTAERNLYFLAKGVLNCWWLTPTLHKPICDWLQACPPYRKMLMIPRGHGKTTIVGQCLPIHLWIQPAATNIYLPGTLGTHTRILMCGETESRAKDHLRVVQHHILNNPVLRALWPHAIWTSEREARRRSKWNDTEMMVPRDVEFPDPSMRAIGVGAAITGAHPNVIIKDDLTTEAAANSPMVMQTAIDWHINSRALFSRPANDLEFISCTRWSVADLPDYIMTKDPTVQVNERWRAIVDGEKPIYPENFGSPGMIAELMQQFGTRFPLLYMNSVADSTLVDFSEADLRFYEQHGDTFRFNEDDRDAALADSMHTPLPRLPPDMKGRRINDAVTHEQLRSRGMHIRKDHYA